MVTALLANPTLSTTIYPSKLCGGTREARKSICGLQLKKRTSFGRISCTANAPYGGRGNVPKFPRMKVWDPYERLGVSPYASEEELWSSRNFLEQQYARDEESVESIEAAFEKILMQSFWRRKKTKINLKTQLTKKVDESPPWLKNLLKYVELPKSVIILRRLFLFTCFTAWAILTTAESGPAFQVLVSLATCVYLLHDKTKDWKRASIIGFGCLAAGWLVGSLAGPLVPAAILPATWGLELLTSLSVFVFLFVGCTFLK